MRLSISLLHLARLNWPRLPPSLPGHQILQRDKAGAAAFVSQSRLLLLLNIFRGARFSLSVEAIQQFSDVFLGPYSPAASWDFLQTPQLSVLLHSPSPAIRDDHPVLTAAEQTFLLPAEPLWPWGGLLLPCELQLPKHLALHFPWDTGRLFSAQ